MPVSITCPTCGKQGRLPDGFQGTIVKCGQCKMRFDVTPWTSIVEPPVPIPDPNPVQDIGLDLNSLPTPAKPAPSTPAPAKAAKNYISIRMLNRHPKLTLYLAGVASGVLLWALVGVVWPKTDWERVATTMSPAYALATFDAGKYVPPDNDNVKLYQYLLEEAEKYYDDDPRWIAQSVFYTCSMLAEKGHGSNPLFILRDSVEAAKNRHSPGPGKLRFRAFASAYEQYRLDGLSHAEAIQKIDDDHKL